MRIGVIGLGFMGTTHLQAWRNVPGAEIVAVCSENPAKLTGDLSSIEGNLGTKGERFDFSRMGRYTRPSDLIADQAVEAVDICLPTNLHSTVAIAALQAGKHVLVEKPMALRNSEAEEMLEAARASGRTLMLGQVLRFLPPYRALADALRSGEYGSVRSATFRRRCAAPFWSKWLSDTERSGGAIVDLLIHDLDYALHVFGEPREFTASGYEDLARGIDVLHSTLHYDGQDVVVSGGWHHPKAYPFSMEFTVVTDGATFDFDSSAPEPGGVMVYNASGEAAPLPLPEQDGFVAELSYFHECCVTGKAPVLCAPEESAAAVRLALDLAIARTKPA